jgi:DNA-binding response OmpR family regulator
MKILLIEDEVEILQALMLCLKDLGYIVDAARDGERGRFMAETSSYDLIILDYNLPKLNGREVIKQLRHNKNNTPILMLTVHAALSDKVDLLNLGADDYLTKPFAFAELAARVQTILRRPAERISDILNFQDITLDADRFIAARNGRPLCLSTKEFSLLEYFLKNPGRILTRQEIMEHVWDENADLFSHTIEVHIMTLRKKLRQYGPDLIFTVPNRGYKLDKQR